MKLSPKEFAMKKRRKWLLRLRRNMRVLNYVFGVGR